jgi:hypothetical protein
MRTSRTVIAVLLDLHDTLFGNTHSVRFAITPYKQTITASRAANATTC